MTLDNQGIEFKEKPKVKVTQLIFANSAAVPDGFRTDDEYFADVARAASGKEKPPEATLAGSKGKETVQRVNPRANSSNWKSFVSPVTDHCYFCQRKETHASLADCDALAPIPKARQGSILGSRTSIPRIHRRKWTNQIRRVQTILD